MASAAARKEVPATVPALGGLSPINQSQISFVDQCGGLKRLARLFLGQPLGGQPAQFVVDQRQQLLGGMRVALLDGGQDAGDFIHWRRQNCCRVVISLSLAAGAESRHESAR